MKNIVTLLILVFISPVIKSQPKIITLQQVLGDYVFAAPAAQQARLSYENATLSFENYKKSFLPSLAFTLSPFNFNRSIKTLQNPADGSYSYVEDFANNSSAGLSLKQIVGPTGGRLDINSRLNMLSEFTDDRFSFNTTVFNIGYTQQLLGGYKNYRFEKTLQQARRAKATKTFCKEMADIQHKAVGLFMNLYLLKNERQSADRNLAISDTLLAIGKSKLENGDLTEQAFLQLELQKSNNLYEIERLSRDYDAAQRELIAYLGIPENVYEVSLPQGRLPDMLTFEQLKPLVDNNNPQLLNQQIKITEAKQNLYRVKLQNGFNSNLNLSLGMNQYAEKFAEAYQRPATQQAVSIGLQIPIFDWGINRNNYKMAKNNYQSTTINMEQELTNFYDNLKNSINDFNSNTRLLSISERSLNLARKQYDLLARNFYLGEVSMVELTNAQRDVLESVRTYNEKMRQVWVAYFYLRSMALYDFSESCDLSETLLKQYENIR